MSNHKEVKALQFLNNFQNNWKYNSNSFNNNKHHNKCIFNSNNNLGIINNLVNNRINLERLLINIEIIKILLHNKSIIKET